eukprot:8479475-Pyramimonas_sp.AAC.1
MARARASSSLTLASWSSPLESMACFWGPTRRSTWNFGMSPTNTWRPASCTGPSGPQRGAQDWSMMLALVAWVSSRQSSR